MAGEVPPEGRVLVVLGGGIGAGKSTIAEVFARHGFAVIEADRVGHEVLAAGSPVVAQVAERWPSTVVAGEVDRNALGGVVFSDPDELAALEAMTHPEIARRIRERISDGPDEIVIEVPLIGVVADMAATRVAVVADAEVRIARAVARGGDPDDVRRRMAQQVTDAEWRRWADVVVDNGGAWEATERSVVAVIEEVRNRG